MEKQAFSKSEFLDRFPFMKMKDNASMTWYDEIPDGWRKAFGIQMVEDLRDVLLKASQIDNIDWLLAYHIDDIKEKWGYLHWYADIPSSVYDDYCTWEDKYTELSYKTCIICGKPAEGYTKGWVMPICKECANKRGYQFSTSSYEKED